MVHTLINVIVSILYSIACVGIGSFVIKLFYVDIMTNRTVSPVISVCLSLLSGCGILAVVWTILLSWGLFYQPLIIIILTICLAISCRSVWSLEPYLHNQIKMLFLDFKNETPLWRSIALLGFLLCLVGASMAFRPLEPQGDAVAFYMTLPKVLAASKKFVFLPGYENFTTVGLIGELHFAALMSLGCGENSKLIVWPIIIVCTMILAAMVRLGGGGRKGQLISLIMLYSSSAVTLLIGDGKVDLFSAAFGVAVFYLLCSKIVKTHALYVLAGLMAGFAVIAKISYAPLIIPCGILLIVWRSMGEKSNHNIMRDILLFGLGALLPLIGHLYKNWALMNEPLAPFIYLNENPFGHNWVQVNNQWYPDKITKNILLTYPLALVFGRYPMQYGTVSFMILAFLPLSLCVSRNSFYQRNILIQYSIVGCTGLMIWILFRPSVFAPRYFLYTILLFIPLAAFSAENMITDNGSPKWMKKIITWCCILGSLIALYNGLSYTRQVLRYQLKNIGDKRFTPSSVERASLILNREVDKKEGRVFNLNYFTFWMNPEIIINMSTYWEVQECLKKCNTQKELYHFLYYHQFRYVFINKKTHSTWQKLIKNNDSFEPKLIVEIYDGPEYEIYQIQKL